MPLILTKRPNINEVAIMHRLLFANIARCVMKICTVAFCVSGCSTPVKMSSDHLASIGLGVGATYWSAEQKLASEGYHCYVSGAKRENFDCTKMTGFFPTCTLRIEFKVDEQNVISTMRIAEPACVGTP
jgi:hypothetical protein